MNEKIYVIWAEGMGVIAFGDRPAVFADRLLAEQTFAALKKVQTNALRLLCFSNPEVLLEMPSTIKGQS